MNPFKQSVKQMLQTEYILPGIYMPKLLAVYDHAIYLECTCINKSDLKNYIDNLRNLCHFK